MARLGDLYQITSGGTPSRKHLDYYQDGTIPWVKTGDLKEKYLRATDEKITEIGLKNSSARIYPKDTVLIAMYGATIGASSILKIEAATNQACAAFVKRDDILPEYLYAFLESQQTRFIKEAVGGAQPNISAGYLKEIDMPLISIEEQRRIAALLDKVSDLIAKRRAQLDKLDLLVKARFVEMFENRAKVKTALLGDISEFVTVGIANSATQAYDKSGIVMLRNQNIKENYLDDSDLIFIKKEFADKYKTKSLKKDDILVIRTGYPGIACLVPVQYEGAQTFTTLIVRLKKSLEIDPNFICHYINSSHGKAYVEGTKVGVAQQNFGAKALALMPIMLPAIKLQNDFSNFCVQVDKLKFSVHRGLDKLETLKKALMQQCFEEGVL